MLRPKLMIESDGVTTENKNPPCWSEGLMEARIAKLSNILTGRSRE